MSKLRRETPPFKTAPRGIEIKVTLPEGSPSGLELGEDRTNVSALGLDEGLSFTVQFDLQIDPGLVAAVLPEGERDNPATHLRVGIIENGVRPRVRDFYDASGTFPGPFLVSRTYAVNQFFGTIDVVPVVMRSSTGSEMGYARHQGAVVTSGYAAGVHFDSPPPRAGNYLDIKYKSFSQEEMLKPYKHLMYYLDTSSKDGEARIYVNEDIEGLKLALTDRQSETGNPRRVRDAIFATITAHAWSQLFSRAVELLRKHYADTGAEPGDGGLEGALPQWARQVIEVWADKFSDSSTLADRVADFEKQLSDNPVEVTRKVDSAIQEMAEVVEAFQGLRPLAKRAKS